MKAKQAYKLVDQLRKPGPRNYYIDCFPKMEPPDNYDEIFECLRSHTIGEDYAYKMLLLLLMLVSQYETHIFWIMIWLKKLILTCLWLICWRSARG